MNAEGVLSYRISGDTVQLMQAMRNAQNSVQGFAGTTKQSFDDIRERAALMRNVLAGVAGALSVGSIVQGVRETINELDRLSDNAPKIGLTAQSLAELGFAAKLSGTDTETLESAVGKLNTRLADAAGGSKEAMAPFAALGIKVKDVNGNIKSTEGVLGELGEKFTTFANTPERGALAVDLFGKSGKELIPFLIQGASGVNKLREEYRQLAGGDIETAAQLSGAFNDNLDKLHVTSQRFSRQIIEETLPTINQITGAFVESKKSGGDFNVVAEGLAIALETVSVLGSDVAFVIKGVGTEIGGLAAQAAALARGDVAGAIQIGKDMKADAADARKALDDYQRGILQARELQKAVAGLDKSYQELEDRRFANRSTGKVVAPVVKKDVKDAVDEYDKLIEKINEKIAVSRREVEFSGKVTDAEKLQIEVFGKVDAGITKLTLKQKLEVDGKLQTLLVLEKEAAARKRLAQQYAEQVAFQEEVDAAYVADSKAREQGRQVVIDYAKAIDEQNEETALEISLIGKSDQARRIALENLKIERDLRKQIEAIDRNTGFDEAQREEQRTTARLAAERARVGAVERINLEASQRLADDVYGSLTDSLFRAWEQGGNFFSTFWSGIKNTIKTTVLKVPIQYVSSAITGVLGLGPTGASAGPLGGFLGGGTDSAGGFSLSNMMSMSNLFNSTGSAGNMLWNFQHQFNDFTDAIGYAAADLFDLSAATGGAIAEAVPYIGALFSAAQGNYGAAIGSAIGTAILPGIGTVIGSVLGTLVDSLTSGGGGPKPTSAFGDVGQYQIPGDAGPDTTARQISESIVTAYQGLAQTLGIAIQDLQVGVMATFDPQGDAQTQLQVRATQNGQEIYNRGNRLGGIENVGRENEDFQADVAVEVQQVLLAAFQNADIGSKLGAYLRTATDLTSAVQTAVAIKQLDQAFERIGGPIANLTNLSVEAELAFVNQMGGVQALSSTLDSYFNNFHTAAEREAAMTRQLTSAFEQLGITMPTTRDGLKALIDGALNDDNAGLAGRLLQLQGAFAELIPAASELTTTTEELAENVRTAADIARERSQLEEQILQLQNDQVALRLRERESIADSNLDLFDRVTLLQKAKEEQAQADEIQRQAADIQRQILIASGDTVAIRAAEMEAIYPANRAMQASLVARQDELKAIQEQQDKEREAVAAAAQLAQQKLQLENELLQLEGNTEELRRRELAAMDAGLVGLQQLINARRDEAAELEKMKGRGQQAFTILQASVAKEKQAVEAGYQSQVAILNAQRSSQQAITASQSGALQAVADSNARIGDGLRELFDVLDKALQGISEKVSDSALALAAAQGQLAQAVANARAGGALPTAESLSGALGVLGKDSSANYITQEDYRFAQSRTMAQLRELQGYTGAQHSVEAQTLAALQTQIQIVQTNGAAAASGIDAQLAQLQASRDEQMKGFDDLLAAAQEQLNAALGQKQATLDLTGALTYYGDTLGELAAANAAAILANQQELQRIAAVAAQPGDGSTVPVTMNATQPGEAAARESRVADLLDALVTDSKGSRDEQRSLVAQLVVNSGYMRRFMEKWDDEGMPQYEVEAPT